MSTLSQRRILAFWLPLAATWMMMAVEGPFLAAVIARLAEPKYNLASHGVAFAFAIIIESPVIMIMSAATALATDSRRFERLRRFTYGLNGAITLFQVVFLATPLYDRLTGPVMGLPVEVQDLTRTALWILLPWPGAIGYRRLWQGLLIRSNLTRRVAYGTVLRISSMGAMALFLYHARTVPGAWVGAGALSAGVCAEALASRFMARSALADLTAPGPASEDLSYREIGRFYLPLALTSTISLAAHPLVTFFMGQARSSLESLAVLPVINSLSFIFRSPGLAFQEVAIALMGEQWRNLKALMRFAGVLGVSVVVGMGLLAWTPLAAFWFRDVSGLSPELTAFALTPTRILTLLPGLSVLLSVQRGLLVQGRHTDPITTATAIEVGGIALWLMLTIHGFHLVGATCAAIAYLGGRLLGNAWLIRPVAEVIRRR